MNALNPDTVSHLILVAREMQQSAPELISAELSEDHDTDHFTQDDVTDIIDDYAPVEHAQDTTYHEFVSAVESLNQEQQNELVALMWLGRGTYGPEEWAVAVTDAKEASNDHTAEYLMRAPLLPDYLEEGLIQMTRLEEVG